MDHAISDQDSLEAFDDAMLVDQARSGREKAVRVLIRRHNRLLFRLVRGFVRDDAEAEDIVQETYVRAFTGLAAFCGEAAFSTWLSRIAINEALGRLRKRRLVVDLDTLDRLGGPSGGDNVIMFPISPAPPPGPEAETARSEIRAALERAVDTLPASYRAVFILRDVEGLSTEDTALHLSIRSETVKTRLHRARRLMQNALRKEFSEGFADLFPFDGERCTDMAERVVQRLRRLRT